MWPDRVSNPGPLTYESGALWTALCGPAVKRDLKPYDMHTINTKRPAYNIALHPSAM